MLLVLSPAKTLDMDSAWPSLPYTQPELLENTFRLIEALRSYSPSRLSKLMGISPKLALLNKERYRDFTLPFTETNAKPALLAFKGDVYWPMAVERYTKDDFAFAQNHLRILSGLYGVLRPLDLMQAYRLEMSTPLKLGTSKDLYGFWGERITQQLNEALAGHQEKTVVNLASEEYFKSIHPEALDGDVLHIEFREKPKSGGNAKIIGLYAKKARGMMADYIVRQRLTKSKDIKSFSSEGYAYQAKLSSADRWIFLR